MSSKSARSNTWTALGEQGNSKLSYWPQVSPSPLTVSLPNKSPNIGSLEIVIVNNTPLDIEVRAVEFEVPIGPDGDVLTSTTNGIQTAVSDSTHWKINPPQGIITSGKARYELLPNNETRTPVKIPKGGSVAVQIYGFATNTTPGAPTIEIIESTESGKATTSFSVTIFPWGFAFSDLAANVREGAVLIPVAQVDREKRVILTWQSSVVDTDSYTVYYSTSQGQQPCRVTTPGEWTSRPLTEETVFTLVVALKNSVGDHLSASMSIVVAVTNPDLVAKSVAAQSATVKGLTIGPAGNQQPSWMIDSSGTSLRFNNSSHPAATASLGLAGDLSVTALAAGKDGMGPADPCAIVAHGDLAFGSRVFVGDTTNTQKEGKRVPTKGIVLDGEYSWQTFLPAPRLRFIENIDQTKEPNTQRHWNIDAFDGLMRFFVEPGYNVSGSGLGSFDSKGNFTVTASLTINPYSYGYQEGDNCLVINSNNGQLSVDSSGNLICPSNVYVQGNLCQYTAGQWRKLYYGYYKDYAGYQNASAPSDLRFKSEVRIVPSALEKVRHLRGVNFLWNEDGLQHFTRDIETTISAGPNATGRENHEVWQTERQKRRTQLATTHIGVLAQDVEAVLPEAVTTDADGYKSVRYDNLIPLLIEAIKEQDRLALRQQAEIERLKLAVGIDEQIAAPERATSHHDEK